VIVSGLECGFGSGFVIAIELVREARGSECHTGRQGMMRGMRWMQEEWGGREAVGG
jgi:hypothetical protein